jgi:transforming growth factor-beta-induced protein
MLNGANVVAVDVEASNGVIHVLDAVLLPPERTAPSGQPGAGDGKLN